MQPATESGHFTQTDPIGIAGGLNTYGYANGDPINFSDPFGLTPCGPFVAQCVSGLFGVVVEGFSQIASGEGLSVSGLAIAGAAGFAGGAFGGAGTVGARVGGQAGVGVVAGFADARMSGESFGAGDAAVAMGVGVAGGFGGEMMRASSSSITQSVGERLAHDVATGTWTRGQAARIAAGAQVVASHAKDAISGIVTGLASLAISAAEENRR